MTVKSVLPVVATLLVSWNPQGNGETKGLCDNLSPESAVMGDTVDATNIVPAGKRLRMTSYAVTIEAQLGWTFLSMETANSSLLDFQKEFRVVGLKTPDPEMFDGSVVFGGSVKLLLGRLLLVTGLAFVSGESHLEFRDGGASLEARYDMHAFEIVPHIGYRFRLGSTLSLDVLAGIGYGKAEVDYKLLLFSPFGGITIFQTVTGSYLARRLMASLHMPVGPLELQVGALYRFADAGVLRGRAMIDGQRTEGEHGVIGIRSNSIEFDFSGFAVVLGVGLSF